MTPGIVGRVAELEAIGRFVDRTSREAGILLLDGAAGVGKTTLVRAAVDAARATGATVLTCAGSPAEARLTYAGLAELLDGVDVPALHRDALDAALMRAPGEADPQAVATGTLAVVQSLAPAFIAVDDLQWLDAPSARVLEFCARRLPARVGLVCSRRITEDARRADRLIGLGDPDILQRLEVGPLAAGELRALLERRTARPLDVATFQRIERSSGGNPFWALELAEASAGRRPVAVPEDLQHVLDAGAAGLGVDAEEALLAVAALADPSLTLLEQVLGTAAADRLDPAERRGMIATDETAVWFTHPLLAEGVYRRATTAQRRDMHRRLAEVARTPEERARHLAFAHDPGAVAALVDAASGVRARGAPDAAAELLELALSLGGAPELAVRCAELHLDAGAAARAHALLTRWLDRLPSGNARAHALAVLGEIAYKGDSFPEGRRRLEQALAEVTDDVELQTRIELQLTFVLFNSPGGMAQAATVAGSALAHARSDPRPGVLAQALAVTVINGYAMGRGVDLPMLEEALALEEPDFRAGAELAPSIIAAFVLAWSGALSRARQCVLGVRARYAERGEQLALAWSGYLTVLIECWRGAVGTADAMMPRVTRELEALETRNGLALAVGSQLLVDGYAGRVDAVRAGYEPARALFEASTWDLAYVPAMALGFLELSVDAHGRAAAALGPFADLAAVVAIPEPTAAGAFFMGDAAEALIGDGQLERAIPAVALLEERGAALDRPWAIAVGARCRGLLQAADGDLDSAIASLDRALAQHPRIEMPVEHARSLLVQGRLLRRARRRSEAAVALERAAAMFDAAGTPRWSELARADLAALGLRRGSPDTLTPSEERTARLAASGLTNREVADRLTLSPKTVEAHLARAYRKLGISSRAELGALMSR